MCCLDVLCVDDVLEMLVCCLDVPDVLHVLENVLRSIDMHTSREGRGR